MVEHRRVLEELIEAINEFTTVEEIEKMLQHPYMNINKTSGELELRPLHHAVHRDRLDCIELFVKYGCNVLLRDKCGFSGLHFAARRGNLQIVKFLVENGGDVHAEDVLGYRPLHLALERGSSDCVLCLLQHGASPDQYYRGLGYEIHVIRSDAPRCIELLLEYGASPESRDVKGMTPLHLAAQSGNIIYSYILLNQGADPNAVTSLAGRKSTDTACGKTALQIAVIGVDKRITEMLLQFGADPNCRDNHSNTPLHYAAAHGNVDIMHFLLRYGARTTALNERHFTPLHRASASNEVNGEALTLLLDWGTNVNILNTFFETPLNLLLQQYKKIHAESTSHSAVFLSKGEHSNRDQSLREIVILLLNRGAKVNFTNDVNDVFSLLYLLPFIQQFQTTADLLLEAAFDVDLSYPDERVSRDLSLELVERMEEISINPRSLKYLTRRVIRDQVLNVEQERLDQLPLPRLLKDYIMYKEFL